MEYKYPTLIADESMKRLHIVVPVASMVSNGEVLSDIRGHREKCDFGGTSESYPLVPFMEAVRLINEEAYRPCGNCLEVGGEVSNWKERAETAEANVRGLNSQLVQSDKLVADWKVQAEAAGTQNRRLRLKGEGQ